MSALSPAMQALGFEVLGNLVFWLLTVLCAAGGLSWFTQKCHIERKGKRK